MTYATFPVFQFNYSFKTRTYYSQHEDKHQDSTHKTPYVSHFTHLSVCMFQ